MKPILFSIGNIKFYSFGIVVLASLIVGVLIALFLIRKNNTKIGFKIDTLILTGLMGIIGARIAFFVLNYFRFESFEQMFYYSKEGLVAWGGIAAASLFVIGLMIKYEDNVWIWLDNMMIGFFGGYLAGSIFIDILSGNSFFDYRLFWIASTLLYLLALKVPRIGKNLNGFLYFFGLMSFSLMQVAIPTKEDRIIAFIGLDLNQIFSLIVLVFVVGFLISITSKKSWRMIILSNILRLRTLPKIAKFGLLSITEKLAKRFKK